MNIAMTGATGFLGKRLLATLNAKPEVNLTALVRRPVDLTAAHIAEVRSIDANTDWSLALTNQQVVIHAAARAHIMKEEALDPLTEYRRVNVDGTLNLARQSAVAGVKRFIFISSIKVNGEQTATETPFTSEDKPAPEDPYGISKSEAEQGLQQLAAETNMEVVIIRPPLVYGAGVKGNFASMIKLVKSGLPLPLGAIHNQRSLVALDNLVDLITTCIDYPAAANQTFLVGDGQDLSTTQLLKGVAKAAGVPSRLIPVPASWIKMSAKLVGKQDMANRLLGNLQVDISKARNLLGWEPPISVEEGLRRCFEPSDPSTR
ncbi:NAD-dependent epimerase/dehydratase family protein [Litorivicinus lipolyticus]|uniref:NAD-dependent epimerase/dehydratase family protein n=1 Tax=Litorivicinus lipolyticus TaxID=418701 RepID=A0A5Q2QAU1_9GAMM|nr:SDR family oxidoreductase [Litorivicinus lipolyticus]QGG79077.1 NAD-dependent epimerase/dehydratase family protein [Litorivicinus lipolyticus]